MDVSETTVPKTRLHGTGMRRSSWRIERFFYRHHRLFGGAIVAGSVVLLLLTFRLLSFAAVGWLAGRSPLAFWMLVALEVAILVIGCLVMIRPSALKRLEASANRWVDLGSVRQ